MEQMSKRSVVSKFCNKINTFNDSINYFSIGLLDNPKLFEKFSDTDKKDMLDGMKLLIRDTEKCLVTMNSLTKLLSNVNH